MIIVKKLKKPWKTMDDDLMEYECVQSHRTVWPRKGDHLTYEHVFECGAVLEDGTQPKKRATVA